MAFADEGDLEGFADVAGLVGVCNRQGSQKDLDQAAADERRVFQERLLMNLPPEFEPHRAEIESSVTIPNLIEKINQHFSTFIIRKWKPGALDQLAPLVKAVEEDLRLLGQPIGQLTTQQAMHKIVEEVSRVRQPPQHPA